MTDVPATENKREIRRHIARAKRYDIELSAEDFTLFEGDVFLDGMNPAEWIDAMTMD